MIKHHFSFKDSFVFGWTKTKQHYWYCFLTFLLATILINTADHIPLLRTIVALFIALAVVHISLLIARDHNFNFESLFTPLLSPKKVVYFVVISALYAIPAILTIVLLYLTPATPWSLLIVLPSIYIMVRLKFFPYVLLDNESDSMRRIVEKSFSLTKNHFWVILLFIVSVGLLNLIGALLFVVGLIVTVPVSIFATAYVYTKLKEHAL